MDMNKVFIFGLFLIIFSSFAFAQDFQCKSSDICLSGNCRTITLTPNEVQSLWDNFLYQALKPSQLVSGAAAISKDVNNLNKDKNTDNCPEINMIDKDKALGAAIKLDCTKKAVDDKDVKYNEVVKGDYAYAMILDKSMRVAKCDGLASSDEKCSVAAGLQFSNAKSGLSLVGSSLAGLVSASAMSSDFTKKDMNNYKDEFLKTKEQTDELAKIDTNSIWSGVKDYTAQTYKRQVLPELIPNHVKTNGFNVEFEDVCTGQDAPDRCKIYIYSFFDRYYNSYYSGTIIATLAGPQVWGLSKKVIPGLKNVENGLAKLKLTLSGGYENGAIKAVENVRSSSIMKGMKADDIKSFEKTFTEGSPEKIRQSFETIEKNLDTPEKRRAFAKYLEARSFYAGSLKTEIKALAETNPSEAIERLIAQGDDATVSGLGTSIVDLYYEKNPKFANYIVDTKNTNGIVDLTNRAVKKDALKGKLIENGVSKIGKMQGGVPHLAVPADQLNTLVGGANTYYVLQPTTTNYIAVTNETIDTIKQWFPSGTIQTYKNPTFKALSTTEYDALMTDLRDPFFKKFGPETIEKIEGRSKDLLKTMYDKQLIDPKYYNPLQWAWYNQKYTLENDFLKKSALLTLGPQLYWFAKTSDSSPWKAYFIGEREMSNVSIYPGTTPLYDDAYVDFFANESFSSGDYFGELIVKNIGKAAGVILPKGEIERNILNFSGVKARDDVKDLTFITTSGNEKCFDCISSRALSGKVAQIRTNALTKTTNYILELPDSLTLKYGLSLAVFGHHTNIDFNITSSKANKITDNINIENAVSSQETCVDKMKTSFFGNLPLIGEWFNSAPSRAGLVVGIVDQTAFYVMMSLFPSLGFIGGGVSTLLVDQAVMSHFEGCVDSEEGYYVHYTHRFFDETSEKESALSSLLGQGKAAGAPAPGDVLDKANKAIDEVKNKLLTLVEDKEKEFLQIKYTTDEKASGKYETSTLWLVWTGARAQVGLTGEDTTSVLVAVAKDANGNSHALTIDQRNNTISMDGKEIIKNDLVDLAVKNGVFGGYELPMSTTFMPADLGVDYFQIFPTGEFRFLDPSTENCALDGARQQTNFSYNNIMEYTGLAENVFTRSPTSEIGIQNAQFNVLGGALERQTLTDGLIVDSNVHLVDSLKKQDFGTFSAIWFQKAIMIYRETQKDFALWLKIIAQINARDVQKFWATPTKVVNPETGCEETAFDLSILGNQNDSQAKADGEKFDTALKNAGPYQYFETGDKIIMFYSKKDVNGQCKEYMKVIDKKTGKVEVDAPITSIEQTDKGFNIKTADGQTHSLEFSSENGRPFLTFDGVKSPLLMAQGRKGSMYFNPETGDWTVANSQMLPFNDKFASEGWVDTGGITTPGGNPYVAADNTLGKKGVWDIPLFDGYEKYLLIIMSAVFAAFAIYYLQYRK